MSILKQYHQHDYPLMRDPAGQPKCYEMTEEERLKAVAQVAQMLAQRRNKVGDPQCLAP